MTAPLTRCPVISDWGAGGRCHREEGHRGSHHFVLTGGPSVAGDIPQWPEDQPLTLTDFLLARLAEDEQDARAAGACGRRWEYSEATESRTMDIRTVFPPGRSGSKANITRAGSEGLSDSVMDFAGHHIARHDPARVLADIEAKRRIVAEHEHRQHGLDGRGGENEWECVTCSRGTDGWWCLTLRALALPYRDHPDWREEWAL